MQIPGSLCFVCQQKIASTFVAVGCGQCERFAHNSCAKDLACPDCQGPLIEGNMLYKLEGRTKLGLRTQAADVGEEALSRAVAALRAGQSKTSIESELRAAGTSEEIATAFAQSLSDARHSTGKKLAIQGALWCLGGTTATIVTYAVARPGGTYVLWWGAIAFGAIRLFRGISMLGRK